MDPRRLLLLSLFALAACGRTEPVHGPLALAGLEDGGYLTDATAAAIARVDEGTPEGWVRLPQSLEPADWQPAPWPDIFEAPIDTSGFGMPPGRTGPHELVSGERQGVLRKIDRELLDPTALGDGEFVVLGNKILVVDRQREFTGGPSTYMAWIERGARPEGRVSMHGGTGEGWILLPGERIEVDLPALATSGDARLTFLAAAHGDHERGTTTTLAVSLDEVEVERFALTDHVIEHPKPQRVDLDDFEGGRLTLAVPEGRGAVLVLAPTLAAAEPPTTSARPDLVLFLADTFRADSMAAYGGDPRLTPEMNAFADEGLTFTGARSSAAWTLPSQSSMLTGLHPLQHDVSVQDRSLTPGTWTLARLLRDAGYRTVAVTDGLFVSERYGLDQGFEIFLEQTGGTKDYRTRTLDRLEDVLELDDGRPLFLFVQTYRTHEPFFVEPDTLTNLTWLFGDDLGIEDWDFLQLVYDEDWYRLMGDRSERPKSSEVVEQLLRLYRGGCHDLDRGFGETLDLFDAVGLGDATVVLTSDHGEAFGEHGGWGHGTSVHEEQVAVPLVIRTPGRAPALRRDPAGLVDLAPTFAALAGLEDTPAEWPGRDLLAPGATEVEGPLLAFEMEGTPAVFESDDLALYVGDRKVILRRIDGQLVLEPVAAYDLGTDPLELGDDVDPAWAVELIERHGAELEAAVRRHLSSKALELSEAEQADLAAMGYTGD